MSAKQVLRSGTGIGANIEEALGGQSTKDFIAKLSIAYKEAGETHYWLRLLKDSDILETKMADSIIADCEELRKLLAAIIRTTKDGSWYKFVESDRGRGCHSVGIFFQTC